MNDKNFIAPKPNDNEPWDVAIIGSGPSALTAAIYTTRGAASTLILGGDAWGGQLMLTTNIDNFPGFPEGIKGPELMQKMRDQAEKFGAEFVAKEVVEVNFDNKPFVLKTDNEEYKASSVIIATGAETRWLGVPGEEKLRGRGVSSCAPCDAPFFKDKNVMVVGGGDAAMEEALVLTKYATTVTIVHRRDEFRASQAMQDRVLNDSKINVLWDSEVVEMLGEKKLEAVRIKTKESSQKTNEFEGETEIKDGYVYWQKEVDGVFVAIGHKPATELFGGKVELDEKGYIKRFSSFPASLAGRHFPISSENINSSLSKEDCGSVTSVPGVFVAGDVHDYNYRQAITAAGFGCMAGMSALQYLDKSAPSW